MIFYYFCRVNNTNILLFNYAVEINYSLES